jgi:hypothetical protein
LVGDGVGWKSIGFLEQPWLIIMGTLAENLPGEGFFSPI